MHASVFAFFESTLNFDVLQAAGLMIMIIEENRKKDGDLNGDMNIFLSDCDEFRGRSIKCYIEYMFFLWIW